MLDRIEVKGFKGIREGTLNDLAQVNLLVGRNNTGKSTVLEALHLVARSIEEQDPLFRHWSEVINERMGREPDGREFRFGLNNETEIGISIGFPDGTPLTFALRPRSAVSPDQLRKGQSEMSDEQQQQYLGAVILIDSQLIRQLNRIEQHLWTGIASDRRDKRIISILADSYGLDLEDLTYIPMGGQYKLAIKTPHHTIPVDSFGEGLRYALAVLFLAASSNKETALLWEEPESHQHPEAMARMILSLFKLAKENSLQLFLTTHSAELIYRALETAEQEAVELKVHHCSLSPDGEFSARSISEVDGKVLSDLGEDLRVLYKHVRK